MDNNLRKILIYGASGGLATSIADQYLARNVRVGLITRASRRLRIEAKFADALGSKMATLHTVRDRYTEFGPSVDEGAPYETVFFTQALFNPTPLAEMTSHRISEEITVGLTDQIQITRSLLEAHPADPHARRNICFTGSTSAYAGFANTSVYCSIKHALVGFVRAMNEEYAATNTRFWLFSMGSMDTEMGHNVPKQDRLTFLQVDDVARRIVDIVEDPSNMFEPEVLIRRRILR